MKQYYKYFLLSFITSLCICSLGVTQDVQLKDRPLPKRHNECHLCHVKKEKRFMPSAQKTQREHEDKNLKHGDQKISCNNCHDINNHNYLRSSKAYPASFHNSSPVCAQCHTERYNDWKKGSHGHRSGGWNKKKTTWHCIDCHNPHDVSFKKMKALSPPNKPHLHKEK
ncbi:MAG: hypothetical protein A3B70_06725 [Deltaproteobacteria bacterium RIFCSPHIGHO2_02_FULL_40_11]|nr:MAG: hypothetical protein A3B70_06725 [Deltaproteobacteria bacterium RIFCSPHIGHO2_02_FULL_40_11]